MSTEHAHERKIAAYKRRARVLYWSYLLVRIGESQQRESEGRVSGESEERGDTAGESQQRGRQGGQCSRVVRSRTSSGQAWRAEYLNPSRVNISTPRYLNPREISEGAFRESECPRQESENECENESECESREPGRSLMKQQHS